MGKLTEGDFLVKFDTQRMAVFLTEVKGVD